MTLEQYIKNLQQIVRDNPEAKKLDTIYASDSEGNCYEEVFFHPTLGHLEGDVFRDEQNLQQGQEINAICIN